MRCKVTSCKDIAKKLITTKLIILIILSITPISIAAMPTVETFSTWGETSNGATLEGYIDKNGGFVITEYGFFVYLRGQSYNVNTTKHYIVGTNNMKGSFSTTVNNLDPNTAYDVQAYAINADGKSYGERIAFITESGNAPVEPPRPAPEQPSAPGHVHNYEKVSAPPYYVQLDENYHSIMRAYQYVCAYDGAVSSTGTDNIGDERHTFSGDSCSRCGYVKQSEADEDNGLTDTEKEDETSALNPVVSVQGLSLSQSRVTKGTSISIRGTVSVENDTLDEIFVKISGNRVIDTRSISGTTYDLSNIAAINTTNLTAGDYTVFTYVQTSGMDQGVELNRLSFTVEEPKNSGVTFSDIPADAWYRDDLYFAAKNGIVTGKGNNKFDPNGNVTLAEMLTISLRILGKQNEIASTNPWYDGVISVSLYCGLLKQNDSFRHNPTKQLTRSETIMLLIRTNNLLGLAGKDSINVPANSNDYIVDVSDVSYLPENEKSAMLAGYASGFLSGNGSKDSYGKVILAPEDLLTRAQATAFVTRILQPDTLKARSIINEPNTNISAARLAAISRMREMATIQWSENDKSYRGIPYSLVNRDYNTAAFLAALKTGEKLRGSIGNDCSSALTMAWTGNRDVLYTGSFQDRVRQGTTYKRIKWDELKPGDGLLFHIQVDSKTHAGHAAMVTGIDLENRQITIIDQISWNSGDSGDGWDSSWRLDKTLTYELQSNGTAILKRTYPGGNGVIDKVVDQNKVFYTCYYVPIRYTLLDS